MNRESRSWVARAAWAVFLSVLLVCGLVWPAAAAEPENGTISGIVVGPEGNPVANAGVSINDEAGAFVDYAPTDAAGAFSIALPPGTYILSAEPPREGAGSEYADSVSQTVEVTAGVTNDVGTISLTTPVLTGQVTAPDGTTPVANARVEVRTEDWSTHKDTFTDEQGNFRIGGLPDGTYILSAEPPREGAGSEYTGSVSRTVEVTAGVTNDVGTISLTTPQIYGKVTLPDGTTPVANARVEVHTEDWSTRKDTFTDEQGNFRIGGLSPNTYVLAAYSPGGPDFVGYTNSDEMLIEITSLGRVVQLSSPIMLNRISLTGRVVGPTGSPVQGAGVDVWSEEDPVSSHRGTSTSEDGVFSFGGLGVGSYRLEIHIPWGVSGWIRPEPVLFDIVDVDAVVDLGDIAFLAATKFVQGTVTRAESGAGVAGVEVHANQRGARGWAHTTTDEQGNYSLGLSGGTWELMISPRGDDTEADWVYLGHMEVVSFSDDSTLESETLDFTVVTADARVTGSVRGPEGEEVNPWAVHVDVRTPDGTGQGRPLSSDGSFDIPILAGTYNVWVHVDEQQYPTWGSPEIPPFSVASGETYELGELDLEARESCIEGRVTRQSDGQGVAGVEVSAWKPEGAGWAHATTDSDGSYSLAVTDGVWEVGVMPSPDSNYVTGQEPRRVAVADGETVPDIDFELIEASGTIRGVAQDTEGNLLADVDGWVYARRFQH